MLGRMAVLCLFGLLATVPLSANQSRETAQQGLEAFKSGDYRQALDYFLQAERGGDNSESLQYNIAVSFYRLKRFQEAEQRFIRLIELPKWRP
ncbi:MAG TPA: hypothetical protein VF268_07275, partial [Gammaproteobacteria bacterium]